jgi:hypothetical protein
VNETAGRIPPIPSGVKPEDLVPAINDRFRRVAALSGGGGAGGPSGGGTGVGELVLAVPGTLAISSSAAPLVSLPAAVTPKSIPVLLKQAPRGGAVQVNVLAGSGTVGSVTISDGQKSAELKGNLTMIPADTAVVVEIASVGLTFPGADLTVMVRW